MSCKRTGLKQRAKSTTTQPIVHVLLANMHLPPNRPSPFHQQSAPSEPACFPPRPHAPSSYKHPLVPAAVQRHRNDPRHPPPPGNASGNMHNPSQLQHSGALKQAITDPPAPPQASTPSTQKIASPPSKHTHLVPVAVQRHGNAPLEVTRDAALLQTITHPRGRHLQGTQTCVTHTQARSAGDTKHKRQQPSGGVGRCGAHKGCMTLAMSQ